MDFRAAYKSACRVFSPGHFPVAMMLAVIALASCHQGKKVDVAASINPKKMPTMTTKNVVTFISDSGIIQYKIVSPLWLVYNERDTPYWSFPKGLYLQKFDRNYKKIASVAADSAKFYSDQKLWQLDGNVELERLPGDLFLTQQLFWNEREHKIYSDSFIHIKTTQHMLEGYGFVSNDRLTDYHIIRPSGMFPFNKDAQPAATPVPPGAAASGGPTIAPVPPSPTP